MFSLCGNKSVYTLWDSTKCLCILCGKAQSCLFVLVYFAGKHKVYRDEVATSVFVRVTWFMRMCDVTHSWVRRDSWSHFVFNTRVATRVPTQGTQSSHSIQGTQSGITSHVALTNESRHTYAWMMSRVTHSNESQSTHNIQGTHGTPSHEVYRKHRVTSRVMSHRRMSHFTHTHESRHTHELVISLCVSCILRVHKVGSRVMPQIQTPLIAPRLLQCTSLYTRCTKYSLSHLQWHIQKLEAKPKATDHRSLFTETWQKRPTSFGFGVCFELLKMLL